MRTLAVVFDLDGTLFDHRTAALTGLRAWIASAGRVSSPDLETAWFAAEERQIRAWSEGEIGFAEQRRRRLREFLPRLNLPVGDDARLDATFADGFLAAYQAAWCSYGDVDECLEMLQRNAFRFGVLTNGVSEQQNAKIDALGLSGRLGPVLTSEELGVAKPDPRAFRAACDRLEVRPEDGLYVGDHHRVDVLGARAAGMRAVYLDRTDAGPREEPARIMTLRDLAGHLGPGPD